MKTGKKIVVIAFVLILALLLCGLHKQNKVVAYEYDTCTSLWNLAQEHCPDDMDLRDFVAAVAELNCVENGTVYADRLYQYPIYAK